MPPAEFSPIALAFEIHLWMWRALYIRVEKYIVIYLLWLVMLFPYFFSFFLSSFLLLLYSCTKASHYLFFPLIYHLLM